MKPTDRFLGLLGWLALAVPSLAAPAAAAPVRPIRFDRLSLEQGLSQSSVMDILQDRRGYVWLATEEGLDRFDGLSFKVYKHDPADAASLPSSFVWDVEEDASGDLWIATTGGLALWQRATDRVVRQEKLAGRLDPGAAASRRRSGSSGSAPATRASCAWTSRAARSRASPTTPPRPRASPTTASTSCTSTARTACGWAPKAASTAGTPEGSCTSGPTPRTRRA